MRQWNVIHSEELEIREIVSHDKLQTYVVEFDHCKVVCATYRLKGTKVVLIKAIEDEEGKLLRDKFEAPIGDFIDEVGVIANDLFKTKVVEAWGELHQVNLYKPADYPDDYLETIPGDGILIAPKEGTLFRMGEPNNRIRAVSMKEVKSRIAQYKRLSIPASFPDWLYCRVKGTKNRYDYIRLRDALSSEQFYLDPEYKAKILSFIS